MQSVAMFLMIFGFLIAGAATLWLVIRAFSVSILWGLGCLFVPVVSLCFLFDHWEKAAQPFGIWLLGIALTAAGALLAHGPPAF
jgi:hypothetical protein